MEESASTRLCENQNTAQGKNAPRKREVANAGAWLVVGGWGLGIWRRRAREGEQGEDEEGQEAKRERKTYVCDRGPVERGPRWGRKPISTSTRQEGEGPGSLKMGIGKKKNERGGVILQKLPRIQYRPGVGDNKLEG